MLQIQSVVPLCMPHRFYEGEERMDENGVFGAWWRRKNG